MISTESVATKPSETLEEVKIEEKFEPHVLYITSPKRAERIKVIRSNPRFPFYKVIYESGKPIPQLSGDYTGAYEAVKAVKEYLKTVKKTGPAKEKERWGDKPIPELRQKKVIRRKKVNDNSQRPTENSQ